MASVGIGTAQYVHRSALSIEHTLGFPKLYNLMDDGAFTDLAALHRAIHVALGATNGWLASVVQDALEIGMSELMRRSLCVGSPS